MKNHIKAGIASEKIFGKIILVAALVFAVAVVLCSCTVDELLEIADSVAREYYRTEERISTNTEPEPVAEPTKQPTEAPTEAHVDEPADEPEITAFGMPFVDKAHGGADYRLTQDFSSSHGGLDFGVYWGDPIIAATDGKVVYAYDDGDISSASGDLRWTYGTFVVIESTDRVFRTYYAHMSRKAVSVGDEVKMGDVVGYSGNTGRVSSSSSGQYAGTHLHFEVRVWDGNSFVKRDPKLYLPRWN